jgi:TonB family protein
MQTCKWLGFVFGISVFAFSAISRATNQLPVPLQMDAPQYPYEMSRQGIGGTVEVEFIIGSEGNVLEAKTSRTTNRAFNQAAEAAILKWRYKPAMKDGRPVGIHARQVVEFSLSEVPVYPFTLAQSGVEGTATVEFSRDGNGRILDVTVVETTQPEFGWALRAAIAASTYAPSFDEAQAPMKGLRTTTKFTLKGKQGLLNEPSRKILARLKNKEAIPDETKLDQPLEAKTTAEPRLPADWAAGREAGYAVIEAFVDEDGNVRLPSVESATKDEFGYAAAQAVSGWKYDPPRVGGKRALVRAKIRVEFKPKG